MGDTSVMARRLSDGHVQYGWSGNGGYFSNTGARLLAWYTEPDDVEYLFGLGQTRLIGIPGSERGCERFILKHGLTGEPCYLGLSERNIFSKLLFIDYAYFYDIDHNWYYINPNVLRIKMPLELIWEHCSDAPNFEFPYLEEVHNNLIKYMLMDYPKEDQEFAAHLANLGFDPEEIVRKSLAERFPLEALWDHYRSVLQYFDSWVLAEPNDAGTEIKKFVLQKASDHHLETCEWDDQWIRKRAHISYADE